MLLLIARACLTRFFRMTNELLSRSTLLRPGTPSTRRTFLEGLAAGGVLAGFGGLGTLLPARAPAQGIANLSGADFDLRIGTGAVNFTGKSRVAHLINGSLPGPLLHWREGDTVTLRVHNDLAEATSIHWHGVLLPANMDGVPGLSFHGIPPGGSYQYRFPVRQNGTYWYHSHSGFQEQTGVYGPLIIAPREPEPFSYDRDHVVMLTDWTDRDPHDLYLLLKKQSDYFNYNRPTLRDLARNARSSDFRTAAQERLAWDRMRMNPSDIADVSGHAYTYLMNGTTPAGNWTGLFRSGERVRLRFINGSSMTYFDVRIPGLKMTVVALDGQYVHPVTGDEIRIGTAETYDVIVEPTGAEAFTIFAQSMDRTGYARGTLAVREGASAPVPDMDRIVHLTMADMGHGGMDHSAHAAAVAPVDHAAHATAAAPVDHAAHATAAAPLDHSAETATAMQSHPASERRNPGVDMQTMSPTPRLGDPGVGLRDNGRRVVTYADLKSLFPDPDGREPSRTVELHLTGHMERYLWSFNGIPFSGAEPLRLRYGERVRLVLVNDTMMEHPIHLHGMWSDLEDEHGEFHLRKHTVSMPPGTKRAYRVTADALGRWAYHCHLLYHMEAGMFREVRVDE
jgi:CopA family copper-resistance protein